MFWRPSLETFARHRNPLLSVETGVTLQSFGVDWLHCLSMGLFPHALGYLIRELIDANAWQVRAASKQREEMSIVQLRASLFDWYPHEESEGRRPSRLQALTPGMLGPADRPFLAVQGGICNGVLRFADARLLDSHGACLGPRLAHWRTCMSSLVWMLEVCRRNARTVDDSDIGLYCDSLTDHLGSLDALDIPKRPKHHQAMELGARLTPHACPCMSLR